jgi:cell division protein ZipA
MPNNYQMSGSLLLPTLLTLGMKYGDMNIFHRHQDNAGNGGVTFSVANIINPGSFDLPTMDTFITRGVTLFMSLPNAGDPFLVFEQMMFAAKNISKEFGATIVDDKRNPITKQTEQHYKVKIREFDRLHRISLL